VPSHALQCDECSGLLQELKANCALFGYGVPDVTARANHHNIHNNYGQKRAAAPSALCSPPEEPVCAPLVAASTPPSQQQVTPALAHAATLVRALEAPELSELCSLYAPPRPVELTVAMLWRVLWHTQPPTAWVDLQLQLKRLLDQLLVEADMMPQLTPQMVLEMRQQQQPSSADAYHASHPTGVLQDWLEAVLGLYDDQGKPQVVKEEARVPDHVVRTCEALGQPDNTSADAPPVFVQLGLLKGRRRAIMHETKHAAQLLAPLECGPERFALESEIQGLELEEAAIDRKINELRKQLPGSPK